MAEHDSERGDREPEETADERADATTDAPAEVTGTPGEKKAPLDEDAAWAAIVAGYGAEPPDPPGARPFKPIKDLALPEPGTDPGREAPRGSPAGDGEPEEERPVPARPVGSSVSFAPGVGGPRDHSVAEPPDEDLDEDDDGDDEGHFVPPEPPPLPETDVTAKFAWLGVLGGPVLLLLAVLLGWEMTWWLQTVGIGGFLGGFVALVMRMNPGDEEDDDPGRGAVV